MLKSPLYCLSAPHIFYLKSTKMKQVNISKVFRKALVQSNPSPLSNEAIGQKDLQVQVLLC